MKVVLVDDDIDDLEIFCEAKAEVDPGIDCVAINGGIDYLQWLGESSDAPDIIFIDLVMPAVNGIECLRETKSCGHMQTTKLIAFSAYDTSDFADALRELDVPILVKPDNFESLVTDVKRVLML